MLELFVAPGSMRTNLPVARQIVLRVFDPRRCHLNRTCPRRDMQLQRCDGPPPPVPPVPRSPLPHCPFRPHPTLPTHHYRYHCSRSLARRFMKRQSCMRHRSQNASGHPATTIDLGESFRHAPAILQVSFRVVWFRFGISENAPPPSSSVR